MLPRPIFFESPAAFRAWLGEHHDTETELWVGYYKRGTGKPSLTWPESVDEALCFGWIDGIRKSVDAERYTNRFTPRTPRSRWSAVNIARVKALKKLGKMRAAGLRAFAALGKDPGRAYSYEERHEARLAAAQERQFRAEKKAWAYFQARPPWYRRAAIHWVASAKKEDTRERRLGVLIAHSKAERTIPPLTRPGSR